MESQTIKLIQECFKDAINGLTAERLYLEHQRGLAPEKRVCELEEDEMDYRIKQVRVDLSRFENAYTDFEHSKNWGNI